MKLPDLVKWMNLKNVLPSLPEEKIDCTGKFVIPAWCDSHTHLVFAGSRENEFVDKIRGLVMQKSMPGVEVY